MFAWKTIDRARLQKLMAFSESKLGVKGLVDAGVTKVPSFFVDFPKDPSVNDHRTLCEVNQPDFSVPVMDLADIADKRAEVIDGVRKAAESVGFFLVVNHGIPNRVMEEMLQAVPRVHELPNEVKAKYYSTDNSRKVRFYCNYNYNLALPKLASWKDSFDCDEALDSPEFPEVCRDITVEYSKHVQNLGVTLFGLLSEALGLKRDHLLELDCAKGQRFFLHYYPPCPEPELTLGTTQHTDFPFLTILLQDQNGGLQFLHQNQWIDVSTVPGSLVVNIGDLLKLVSNDKFKSVIHRVLANKEGPRLSVACFFKHQPHEKSAARLYEPIKELTSEENPPKYKGTTVDGYVKIRTMARGLELLKL